ncbi:MAG: hypothetical protein KAI72_05350 [Candidatus Pacebacteria bacterium]|nr:hypothetical protein [Candidatus Paceibacterota bacterium]
MTIISQPKVTVNKLPATLPVGVEAQKILVVGQITAAATVTPDTLYEGVAKADLSNFGEGSMIKNMLKAMFDTLEDSGSLVLPRIDAIPISDAGAAVDATSTIVLSEVGGATGLADEAGTITITIGSEYNYTASVDIAVGDALPADIGAAIVTAVNALTDIPVLASFDTATVTFTALNGGTVGNGVGIKIGGLTLSGADYVLGNVKFVLTGFESGATDPTLTSTLDVIGTNRYQTVIHPSEYGTTFSVDDKLDSRFNVDNDILDGVVIITKTGSYSDLNSALALLNSQSLVVLCNKPVAEATYDGQALLELDYVISARFAALRALRRTEDANITRVTPASARGSLDASGGIHISSLPYFNTPLYHVSPIPTGKGFTALEIENLRTAGGSVVGNNRAGNQIILGEIATTYKTDVAANADLTWKNLNAVDTMSSAAEYFFVNLKSDFVQSRLTEGDLINGYAMVNSDAFKAQMVKYYLDLSDEVLVPKGSVALAYFSDNITILIDMVSGKITGNANMPIVVQLREILVNLKTTFTIAE